MRSAIAAQTIQSLQPTITGGKSDIGKTEAVSAPPKDLNYWSTRNIDAPTNYIFGYGSLVNSQSRMASLGNNTFAIPARISSDFGYVRKWNFHSITKMTALGLERVNDGKQTINGVIYPVSTDDMTIWDNREVGYKRIEVPWRFVQSVGWQGLPSMGKLWAYVPEDGDRRGPANYDYPIVQSYVDVCTIGFLEYGEEFTKEFLETTGGWSEWWLNDRLIERRPWVYLREHGMVDKLLANYPSRGNAFNKRQHVAFEADCIPESKLCSKTVALNPQ
ncbi:MAG: gamma-glutamylcyclotransferase [Proteobacteria bacterium]|nr:gamma-glutamylcyclotransferase [Pseudomonadota bacterium]